MKKKNWTDNWSSLTKDFILCEGVSPKVESLIQNVETILSNLSPRSKKDQRDLEVARHNLNQIRKKYKQELSELKDLREELSDIREIQDV